MPITVQLPEDDLTFEFDDSYSNQDIANFISSAPWRGEEDPRYQQEAEAEDAARGAAPMQFGEIRPAQLSPELPITLPEQLKVQRVLGEAQEKAGPEYLAEALIPPEWTRMATALSPSYQVLKQIPGGDEYAATLADTASQFTTLENAAMLPAFALAGPAGIPAMIGIGGQEVQHGAEEIAAGRPAAGLAHLTVGGGMLAPALIPGRGGRNASRIQEATEVYGDVRPPVIEGAREVPIQEGGQRVQPRTTAEEGQVLLSPEGYEILGGGRFRSDSPPPPEAFNVQRVTQGGKTTYTFRLPAQQEIALPKDQADLLERAALDAPEPIKTKIEVAEVGSPGDPFARTRLQDAGDIMTIDREGNRIIVRLEPFQRWLESLRQRGADVAEAVRSRLQEEDIHLRVPDEVALEYRRNLSPLERRISDRRYADYTGDLTETILGHEALRFRIQQAKRMTPGEFLEMTRLERWTWQGITALEKAIRFIREKFTKEGQAARAAYDRALSNVTTAKESLGAPPAARPRRSRGQLGLDLPMMKAGEARPPPPEVTTKPIEFERAAYRHLTEKTASNELPSFRSFVSDVGAQFGGRLQPGALAEMWERNVWRRLFNADGTALANLRNKLGLEKKLGDRTIADSSRATPPKEAGEMGLPGAEDLPGMRAEALARRQAAREGQRSFRAAQRYRTRVITEIGMRMMKDAEEHMRLRTTKEITPEDIRETGGKRYSQFEAIGEDVVNHPPTLEAVLTDDAGVFGGRMRQPENVTKRVAVMLNKTSGKVDMVSVYKRGDGRVMVYDPNAPKPMHRELSGMLQAYRPIYSVLLDKPVKNFHQRFENLGEFQQKFGEQASRLRESEGAIELPTAEEAPVPGAWEAAGPITDAEAGAILDHIISEVGKFDSASDVALAIDALKDNPNPQVISGLRKLGLELDEKQPNLSNADWIQRLSEQIYDTHKKAESYEDFVGRTVEQAGGRRGEVTPTPEALPPSETARELEGVRPRGEVVARPGRVYTGEEWQRIERERARLTGKSLPPAARPRSQEGRFGYLVKRYITDPAKGFGDAYSGWLTDRVRQYGGKVGDKAAADFNKIASRVKEIEGDNRDVFNAAKIALAGSRDLPVVGQVPDPAGIAATKWLSEWDRQWTPSTATARVVGAMENTLPINLPPNVQKIIDPARAANLRAGQIVQPVTKRFTPSYKFERHLTARGYDMLKAGLDNPTTREWAKGNIIANKGRGALAIRRWYRKMYRELAKDVPDLDAMDRINQDFARRIPRVVTHVRTPAGWVEVLHTQPYNYIENTIRRAAYIRAFRETFPMTTAGKSRFKDFSDEVRQALPPEQRGAWGALLKLAQGMPADSYSTGWMAPGKGWAEVLRNFNQTIVRLTVARVLSGQMVTQPSEVVFGGTAKMFGMRTALEATLKLPEFWDTAEIQGQVNRAFMDWGYDVHSPTRSIFKMGSNLISKVFAEQFLNEVQGRQNAIAAQIVTDRIINNQLSRWEKRRLPETFRQMGFSEAEVAKMMGGDAELLAQFKRKAPAWLSTENRLMSEGSTLGTNRLFNSVFRFSQYPMMKLNQFRRAWGRLSEAKTAQQRVAALEGLAREAFYTTAQGTGLTLFASLVFGGPTGLGIRLHEAKDEPFKFLFESFLASMGGPIYMVYQGARNGGLLGVGEGAAQMLFPYSVGRDIWDLMNGEGVYRDMNFMDRLLKNAEMKTPGLRVIKGALAMSGLKENYLPLEQSIRGYKRWSKSEFGNVRVNSNLNEDERKHFRTEMRAAERALQQGDRQEFRKRLHQAVREAYQIKPREGKKPSKPEQRIAQSLRARKILQDPEGRALTNAQMKKLANRIGVENFQRLIRYDAMIENLAESISPKKK